MKTNRFAPSPVVVNRSRSGSLRVLGGLACAAIATLGATGAASADALAPANGPANVAPAPSTQGTIASFALKPIGKVLRCLAQYPDDASRQPEIDVQVVRGSQNDRLFLHARYIKPNLRFDMFTVEKDPLKADGSADPAFTNFGFAWYQSDLLASSRGEMSGESARSCSTRSSGSTRPSLWGRPTRSRSASGSTTRTTRPPAGST